MKTISLINDFSPVPGGRYRWQGEFSGEEFRDDFLSPPLNNGESIVVDLNGAVGLPSSFIDEAFGPLASFVRTGMLKIVLSDNDQAIYNLNETLRVAA